MEQETVKHEKITYWYNDDKMFRMEGRQYPEIMKLIKDCPEGESWVLGRVSMDGNVPHMDKILPKDQKFIDMHVQKLKSEQFMPKGGVLVWMPGPVLKNDKVLQDLLLHLKSADPHIGTKGAYVIDLLSPESEPEIRRRIISEICDSLERMIESGSADSRMFANAEKLRQFLQKTKDKWRKCGNPDGTHFYSAANGARLVLDGMSGRFSDAKNPADITRAAKDSLSVMPLVGDVLDAADADRPTDQSRGDVIHKKHCLLYAATCAGLDGALKADMAKIDKGIKRFVAENLIEALDEELYRA